MIRHRVGCVRMLQTGAFFRWYHSLLAKLLKPESDASATIDFQLGIGI